MIFTDAARGRFCRHALDDGFIRVSENGDPFWKFRRGGWTNRRIVDVRIAPDGIELWIKVSETR